jgi:phospholipase C
MESFDNLFGKFPGANGLANAGDKSIQVGPDGKAYKFLPTTMNTNLKPPNVDKRFPTQLPNRPFQINRFVSLNDDSGDLTNGFYQEKLQINDGAMNRYADVSTAKGLAMGYFDISGTYQWKLAKQFTLGDAMFHSAFGGSFLNHAFLVCSCAFRWPNASAAMVARLDADGNMVKDGQVTPDGYAVNTSRSVYLHAPNDTDQSKLVPPQTMPHIGDRLDAKNISWKWYSGGYDDAMAGHPDKVPIPSSATAIFPKSGARNSGAEGASARLQGLRARHRTEHAAASGILQAHRPVQSASRLYERHRWRQTSGRSNDEAAR